MVYIRVACVQGSLLLWRNVRGTTSTRRDVLGLDRERDVTGDGGGECVCGGKERGREHEKHAFSVTSFLDAPY